MFYFNEEWLVLKGKLMDVQDRLSMGKNVLLGLFGLIVFMAFVLPYVNTPILFPFSDSLNFIRLLVFTFQIVLVGMVFLFFKLRIGTGIRVFVQNLKIISLFRSFILVGLVFITCLSTFLILFSEFPIKSLFIFVVLLCMNFIIAFFVHYLPFLYMYHLHNKEIAIKDIRIERDSKLFLFIKEQRKTPNFSYGDISCCFLSFHKGWYKMKDIEPMFLR